MHVQAIMNTCDHMNPDLFRRGTLDFCLGYVERVSPNFEGNGAYQLCGERTEKMSSIFVHQPQKGERYQLCAGMEFMLWDTHNYTFNSSLAVSCVIGSVVGEFKKAFLSKVPGTNASPYQPADIFSIWVVGKLGPLPESVFDFGVRSAAGIWSVEASEHKAPAEAPAKAQGEAPAKAPATAKCKPEEVHVPKDLSWKSYT